MIVPSTASSVVIAGRSRRNATATARARPVLKSATTSASREIAPASRLAAEPTATTAARNEIPAARRRRGVPRRRTRPIAVRASASTTAPIPMIVCEWSALAPSPIGHAHEEGRDGGQQERRAQVGEHLDDREARPEDVRVRRADADPRGWLGCGRGGYRRCGRRRGRGAGWLRCLRGAQPIGRGRVDQAGGLPAVDAVEHSRSVHAPLPCDDCMRWYASPIRRPPRCRRPIWPPVTGGHVRPSTAAVRVVPDRFAGRRCVCPRSGQALDPCATGCRLRRTRPNVPRSQIWPHRVAREQQHGHLPMGEALERQVGGPG